MSSLLVLLVLLLLWVFCRRKRRPGEPPLVSSWVPFIGKTLEYKKDDHKFLEEQRRKYGDVFTVLIAGKYMTFIMDPLLYPKIIKHGRQLDFHKFTQEMVPSIFGYPPVRDEVYPGLWDQIRRSYQLLQGDNLSPLTESMMGNLMLVFRQDHLDQDGGWKTNSMYEFCSSAMFEATFLTIYGKPETGSRHVEMEKLRDDFVKFDNVFLLLIAQIPIWLLGQTKAIREKLINYFLPQQMSRWSNMSQFIRRRSELFNQQGQLKDVDKAAHHFTTLWASVSNTIPATFWAAYYLVKHPEALQVVRQQILDVLRDDGVEFSPNRDTMLSRDQLDKLVFLESSINESLRLSSSSMNIRVAQEDFALRLDTKHSVDVRKGDIIALYPRSMHLDPEIYEDPQTFHFSRFVQDSGGKTDFYKNGQKLKYYLMPFGSGSSICPGRFFAMNEIKQFVCLLLLYFDLQLEDEQKHPLLGSNRAGLGILQPSADVVLRYRRRAQ